MIGSKDRLNRLAKKMRKIINKANEENRQMSMEECELFDKLECKIIKLTKKLMETIEIETKGYKGKYTVKAPLYVHNLLLDNGFKIVHGEHGFGYVNDQGAEINYMRNSQNNILETGLIAYRAGMCIDFIIPIIDPDPFEAMMKILLPVLDKYHPYQKMKIKDFDENLDLPKDYYKIKDSNA